MQPAGHGRESKTSTGALRFVREFLKLESAGGIVLFAAAALAFLLENSPLSGLYETLLHVETGFKFGTVAAEQSLLHWINDGLMAIFFLLVGLEIKRELLEGQLSTARQLALPGLCAVGGMVVPAAVYMALNWARPENLQGWAIPAATDIAFAMGVMALAGKGVPQGLKVFLLALAIIDDLGAIVIIACFYTSDLSLRAMSFALAALLALAVLNRFQVRRLTPYLLVGAFLWFCVLKSGVHATLSGVALAFAIPLRLDGKAAEDAPLRRLEHRLHPWVTFGIMPIFAFANAGVPLGNVTLATLLQPLTLGIAAGLFFGKQVGVMLVAVLGRALGIFTLPQGAGWLHMYGAALLTGIGFTMSLFIGTLAFDDPATAAPLRLGVLGGSIASAIAGYWVLRLAAKATSAR